MADIGSTHRRVVAKLWALEGKAWLEAQGEIHEAYKQAPFFILLAREASGLEAHRQFWSILQSEGGFGDYRPSVSYKALADDDVLWLGFFDGEADMQRALDPLGWGAPIRQDFAQATLFKRVRDRLTPAPGPLGKRR